MAEETEWEGPLPIVGMPAVSASRVLAFSFNMRYTVQETEEGALARWLETLPYVPGSGDEWMVLGPGGERLGLSCEVHGRMYYIPLAEVPEGSTSAAWKGPWPLVGGEE